MGPCVLSSLSANHAFADFIWSGRLKDDFFAAGNEIGKVLFAETPAELIEQGIMDARKNPRRGEPERNPYLWLAQKHLVTIGKISVG